MASSQSVTSELAISETLRGDKYTISELKPSSANGNNYVARTPDNETVLIKEFFLRDLCMRNGNDIVVRQKADQKLFKGLVAGFIKDARFLTTLESAFLATVREVFEQNGTAYMVTNPPKGVLLAEVIDKAKYTPEQIKGFASQLAHALIEVHGFGMLHRNICPDNIMIENDEQAVLLPDFGTFREDRSSESRIVSSMLRSADHYAPYEVTFEDARQGDGSDLFSLASVIYHMITGAAPIQSLDRVAKLAEGKVDPYVELQKKDKKYGRNFLLAVDMSLELFIEKRVQSATEFLRLIREHDGADALRDLKNAAVERSMPLKQQGLIGRLVSFFSGR